jgi:hypothetical protein
MDLHAMARRMAADPKRRSILTTRANVDSRSPGPSRTRSSEEMLEHLRKSDLNAVLIETGDGVGWVAVFRERTGGDWEVARVPTKVSGNVLGRRIGDPSEAVAAAMMV